MRSNICIIYFFLALFIISCSDDSNETPIAELQRLEITSSNGSKLDLGEKVTLTVTGFDQFDNEFSIEDAIQWSSNNDNVNVDLVGQITGLKVGSSIVTASANSVSEDFEISVWDSSAPRTEIYVSDAAGFNTGPYQIMKFDENGRNGEVFIDDRLAWPQDIVFIEEEEVVLISNLNSDEINIHDANTGDYIETFASNIDGPTRMKVGPDGLLYVLQWRGNGTVLRYELGGTFMGEFTTHEVSTSIGLDWDESGNLYVSSFGNDNVAKFDSSGELVEVFINSNLEGPTNIWFDNDGNLIVNDYANSVKQFDSDGNFVTALITGMNQVEGVDFLDGNILLGNGVAGGPGTVKLFDSNYNFIKDIIPSNSGLRTPNVVVVRKVNQ